MSFAHHLSATYEPVALDEGEDAADTLLARSGALHTGVVLLLAFVAFAGSAPGLTGGAFLGKAPVFALLIVIGASMAFLWRSPAAPLVGLLLLALGAGCLLGLLDRAALPGLGTTFALAVTLAEAVALSSLLARRPSLSAPLSLAVAAAVTGALAYLLDGGTVPSTPAGIAVGGTAAIAFVLHARYAEGAVVTRHGAHQIAHAALTRWIEGFRGIVLALHQFFSGEDDLRRGAST